MLHDIYRYWWLSIDSSCYNTYLLLCCYHWLYCHDKVKLIITIMKKHKPKAVSYMWWDPAMWGETCFPRSMIQIYMRFSSWCCSGCRPGRVEKHGLWDVGTRLFSTRSTKLFSTRSYLVHEARQSISGVLLAESGMTAWMHRPLFCSHTFRPRLHVHKEF